MGRLQTRSRREPARKAARRSAAAFRCSCCSCSLVYSRTTKTSRFGCDRGQIGQRRANAPRRFVPNRRRFGFATPARIALAERTLARGGKPSNVNRRSGKPESSATPIAALGPGKHLDRDAGGAGGGDELASGIGDARHPGVARHSNERGARAFDDGAGRALGVCFAITPKFAAVDPERAQKACARRAYLRRRSVRRRASTSSARSVTSRRLPSGVGTKTNGMARGFDVEQIPPGAKLELYISPTCPYCQQSDGAL